MPVADIGLPEPYYGAINRYLALAASSPAVLSVALCGGLENPGLSDIDLLLVISDYRDLRADPILCLRLLNPEGLSNLFTHGPFLCRAKEYADLMAFTTLKPRVLWCRDAVAQDTARASPPLAEFGTLPLQAAYITHLTKALPQADTARHRLLLAGSVKKSLIALSPWAGPVFQDAAARRAERIASLRSDWCRKPEPAQAEAARAEALSACVEMIFLLASLLRRSLQSGGLRWNEGSAPKDDMELVVAFRDAFFSHGLGTRAAHHVPLITVSDELKPDMERRFRFVSSLLDSQLRGQVLALGAEFPFAVPGLPGRIGARIWLRRLLKRTMRLLAPFQ